MKLTKESKGIMNTKKCFSLEILLKNFWVILLMFQMPFAWASNRTVDLVVSYKTVTFAGKPVQAIVVNNQLPAPTLHFKEGDHLTINVYNHLDKGTSIHWHGLIVPWNMDGVENVSQAPIPPGDVFHYQFTLKQSGTYWYHAHTGFQEQQGLYGAIVIDPLHSPAYHYTKDQVILLSDWSNTPPEQIYANLKKEGDYYSPNFPQQPSLMRFLHDYYLTDTAGKKKILMDYHMMQQMRMSIYDFSDVAYDAFLLNGHPNDHYWTALVKVSDIVRLRFIDAGSGTIFHVKIPGTTIQVVQMQGHDVVPYTVKDFTLAPGETLDALVKVTQDKPYPIYAESSDTLGAAIGALLTNAKQSIDIHHIQPFPTPEPATMMGNMDGMDMYDMSHDMSSMNMDKDSNMGSMKMDGMDMPMSHSMQMDVPMAMNKMSSPDAAKTTSVKYQNVKATVKTNDPNVPVQTINMELSGYMGRYIWFINGVPEMDAKPIIIEPGKRYRLIFFNNSMMHHPMHIHGHWFILRNGHGAFDPLLHTLDIAPGETVVADVDADASGQWIFHCHLLYHMMSGMTRVFRYRTFPQDVAKVEAQGLKAEQVSSLQNKPSPELINPPQEYINHAMIHHPMGEMSGLFEASYLETGIDPARNIDEITFKSLIGSDYNKLELYTEDAEIKKGTVENADMDFFYWHLISEFWAIKGGMNYFYRPSGTPYWQPGVGIEGLMPYFIDTNLRTYYHSGSTKFDLQLSRDTQITNRFFIRTGIRSIAATKTVTSDQIGSGLNQMQYIIRSYYQLSPTLALFTEYNHTRDYGALVNIRRNDGASITENTLTLGVSLLF